MVIAFKERIRFSRVIGLSLPKYEALWRYCAIAAIKQMLHKVHKKNENYKNSQDSTFWCHVHFCSIFCKH